MKPNMLLKREREWRGWSQARVAKEIGIDPQSVSRWERGVAHPYPLFREKLCLLFEKSPRELGLLEWDQTPQDDTPTSQPTPSHERIFDPTIPLPQTGAGVLIGRTALLDRLKQALLQPEGDQLIILRGLPGVGKTTLAATIAHDEAIQAHFHDGILWAGLGPAPNLLGHMSRWGAQFGYTTPVAEKGATTAEWAHTLRSQVQQRQVLFILDDAWELETVLALKIGGNRCAYLVTTRVPQVAQYFAPEQVWTVSELNEQESLSLLTRFVPTLADNDTSQLSDLLSTVGGLPLALTLIGRYLRAQASTGQPRRLHAALQVVSDMHTRLHLSEPSTLTDHQPSLPVGAAISLHSIIAVSEQRLGAQERQALRTLSLFPAKPNSFSEEAALAVCQIPVEVLDTLSDVGFLESPEARRYYLHPIIADYAHLNFTPTTAVISRFATYMVHFVEERGDDYNLLELEQNNILAALEQALHQDMADIYIRGVLAISTFFEIRGFNSLATTHLRQAHTLAQKLDNRASMLLLLFHLGQIAQEQSQLSEAEAYLREGLLYARQLNDYKMINHFLMRLAEVFELYGNYGQAWVYLSEGLALAGYPAGAGKVFSHFIPIDYSEEKLCVYFTEPQRMLRRGYLADIDAIFHSWPHAHTLSPTYLKFVTGPDGHLYGVPTESYVMCLAYNRRLFREAGLDPDRPPTTWEEFRAVARQVSHPHKGIYGFAIETIFNQGGWQFTSWLYTAGTPAQQQQQGRWQATFNDSNGVQFLEMLKEMRFSDHSIPRQSLLGANDTLHLFRTGQVAMFVTSPDVLSDLYHDEAVDINDIGLAPMPQRGGNACLIGGSAFVFNARSSQAAIATAFEQVVTTHFRLDDYATCIQTLAASGAAIGIPNHSLFTEAIQAQRDAITEQYINLPIQNYRPFMENKLQLLPEPPVEAQKYYALLDPIIQAVLINPRSQSQLLLDVAAQQFQERFLDRATAEDFPS